MSETPPAEAVERLPELGQATVDPGGTRVAFYHVDADGPEIRVLDLATGKHESWTDDAGDTAIWPLAWSADGERVLYHRDPGSGTEADDVYAVGDDGAPEPVVETDGATHLRGVGPDGDTLLVRSNHEGGMDAYLCDRSADDLVRLTDRDEPVYRPVLAPDGERVAYPADGDVVVCDATGDVRRTIEVGDEASTATPADWAPDGDRLLLADDTSDVERCGVYDLRTGDVTWVGTEAYVEEPECFLPDGRRFLALRERDALAVPVACDPETGACREFGLPDGVSDFGRNANRIVDNTRVLVTHATPSRPPTLLVYDVATDDHEVVLERDYGPFEPDDFVDPVYERVTSNGVPDTRQAAVEHDPAETFEAGTLFWDSGARPSPLVVYPHGGPTLSSRRTFAPRVQFLCLRGYSVLQVNYRGSSGRGRAFRRALHGDWGGAEQGDIATAVERALDAYNFLDEDRVAVYGGSFGGFSSYWQLLQYPDLYAAGAAVVGMTDLEDMYERTLPQFRSGFLRTHLGTPEENPELYRKRSPVTHARNLDAPILIVHGRNDPRVPVSQARRFRDALVDAGYEEDEDLEYHELDGSGHFESTGGVSKPLALLDDFLRRRLSA